MSESGLLKKLKLFRRGESVFAKVSEDDRHEQLLENFEKNPDADIFPNIVDSLSGKPVLLKRAYAAMARHLIQLFNHQMTPIKFRILCGVHRELESIIQDESEHQPWLEMLGIRTVLSQMLSGLPPEDYEAVARAALDMPAKSDMTDLNNVYDLLTKTILQSVNVSGPDIVHSLVDVEKAYHMVENISEAHTNPVYYSREYLLSPELSGQLESQLKDFRKAATAGGMISLEKLVREGLNVAGIKAGKMQDTLLKLQKRLATNPEDREAFEKLLNYHTETRNEAEVISMLLSASASYMGVQEIFNRAVALAAREPSLLAEHADPLEGIAIKLNTPEALGTLMEMFIAIQRPAPDMARLIRQHLDHISKSGTDADGGGSTKRNTGLEELLEQYLWQQEIAGCKESRDELAEMLQKTGKAADLEKLKSDWSEKDPAWSAQISEFLYKLTGKAEYLPEQAGLLAISGNISEALRIYRRAGQKGLDVQKPLEDLVIQYGSDREKERLLREKLLSSPGDVEIIDALFEIELKKNDVSSALLFIEECSESLDRSMLAGIFARLQAAFPDNDDVRRQAITFALDSGDEDAIRTTVPELLKGGWDQALADQVFVLANAADDFETMRELYTIDPRSSDRIWYASRIEKLMDMALIAESVSWVKKLACELIDLDKGRIDAWRALLKISGEEGASAGEDMPGDPVNVLDQMYDSVPGIAGEVLEYLEALRDRYEEETRYHILKAKIFHDEGRKDDELAEYMILSELDQDNSDYFNYAVDTLIGAERIMEAFDLISNSPVSRGNISRSLEACERLLESAVALDNRDEVITILRRIIVLKPSEFRNYERLAEIYMEVDDIEAAFSTIEEGSLLPGADRRIIYRLLQRLYETGLDSIKLLDRLIEQARSLDCLDESFSWTIKRLSRSYDGNLFALAWAYAREKKLLDYMVDLIELLPEKSLQNTRAYELFNVAMTEGVDDHKRLAYNCIRKISGTPGSGLMRRWISWLVDSNRLKEAFEELKAFENREGVSGWILETQKKIVSSEQSVEHYSYLASLHLKLGNYDEAARIYSRLAEGPGGREWLGRLDEILTLNRRWMDIIEIYEKVQKNDPAAIRRRLRLIMAEKGVLPLEVLEKLYVYFPESPEVLKKMIESSFEEGRLSVVPEYANKLMRISAESEEFVLNVISRLKRSGRISEKLYALEQDILVLHKKYGRAARMILERYGDDANAVSEIKKAAELLLKEGKLREVLSLYERNQFIAGADVSEFLERLSRIADEKSDKSSLIHILELRRRHNPDLIGVQARLVTLYGEDGRYEEAVERLVDMMKSGDMEAAGNVLSLSENLIRRLSDNRALVTVRARAMMALGDYGQAVKEMEDLSEQGGEIFNLLAEAYQRTGNYSGLWKLYGTQIKDPAIRYEQMERKLDEIISENVPLALRIIHEMLEYKPENIRLRIQAGCLHIRRGDHNRATELLQQAENICTSDECALITERFLETAREAVASPVQADRAAAEVGPIPRAPAEVGPIARAPEISSRPGPDNIWHARLMEILADARIRDGKIEEAIRCLKKNAELLGLDALIVCVEKAFAVNMESLAVLALQEEFEVKRSASAKIMEICASQISGSGAAVAYVVLLEIARKKPGDPEILKLCADAADKCDARDEMAAIFPELLSHGAQQMNSRYIGIMADIYISISHFDDARICAEKLQELGFTREALELLRRIRLERKMSGYQEDILLCMDAAKLHRQAGALALAAAELETALLIEDRPELRSEIADVYLQAEDYEKALFHLRTLYRQDPSTDEISVRIRKIEREYSQKRIWTLR